jgi:hypothetical protein
MPLNALTLFTPLTCSCQIILAYDDTLTADAVSFVCVDKNEAEFIHAGIPGRDRPGPIPNVSQCTHHKSVSKQDIFPTLQEEGRRVHAAYRRIMAEISGIDEADIDAQVQARAENRANKYFGVSYEELGPEIKRMVDEAARKEIGISDAEYSWSYDGARQLYVKLPGRITADIKNKVRNGVEKAFGAGKVKIL